MKIHPLLTAVFLATLALAGCDKTPAPAPAAPAASATATSDKAASEPVSIAAITASATGFTVGEPMAAHTVYVFFDAECPHCADLWEAAKPLKTEARFVWIPVGVLNQASTDQGAAILASKDPAAAMDAHETSMRAHLGGIKTTTDTSAQKAEVKKNTELMIRFGFDAIPTIVATNAQTGALVTQEGASATPALAKLLGLRIPFDQTNAPAS
ncbi:MAG: DsbC family protein [Burkholderiaceae bacterium]|nr:MAG: DsbC family protein [Burkholderiaceae bacterium]